MRLRGNAAFIYTDPATGQEQVARLPAPLRGLRPRHVQRRFTEESLDRSVVNVVTVGNPVYELEGSIRFVDVPDEILALVVQGANGVTVTYVPDLTVPRLAYDATLLLSDDVAAMGLDADFGAIGWGEITVLLRKPTPWGTALGPRELIFRYRAGAPLPAGSVFTRASEAYRVTRDGGLASVQANVLRTVWLDLDGDGVRETAATRLEGARTNDLWDSSNFASAGTAWSGAANFTVTSVTSILTGQTAYRHANLGLVGSANRSHTRGVLTGGPETFWCIVENVDAVETSWGLYDVTLTAFVARGNFVWATGAATIADGAGTVYARQLAATGPNGGALYLLAVTGTGAGGNNRAVFLYPSGVLTNTQSAILHHAQLEAGSFPTSPIVTGAAAGATRAVDTLYCDAPPAIAAPGAMTFYARFIERGSVSSGYTSRIMQIGSGSNTPPRLLMYYETSVSRYRLLHINSAGGSGVFSTASAVPSRGDLVELVGILNADGSVQLLQSINQGAALSASPSGALALDSVWSGATVWVGSINGANPSFFDALDLLIMQGALSGTAEAILDRCRVLRGS